MLNDQDLRPALRNEEKLPLLLEELPVEEVPEELLAPATQPPVQPPPEPFPRRA